MIEHPTPWRVHTPTKNVAPWIVDADGYCVATGDPSNLERIVAAVNAHDRLVAALKHIATTNHCSYEGNFTHSHNAGTDDEGHMTSYITGVADGHRCAAQWAREVLDAVKDKS